MQSTDSIRKFQNLSYETSGRYLCTKSPVVCLPCKHVGLYAVILLYFQGSEHRNI